MEATVVRRNRIAGALTAFGIGGPLALTLAAFAGGLSWESVGPICFDVFFYACIPAAVWYGYYLPTRRRGTVSAARGELRAQDSRGAIVLRATTGRIDRLRDGRWRVEVREGKFRRLRVEVATEAEARSILTDLGVDRREGTTRFVVQSNVYDALFPILLGVLLLGVIGLSTIVPPAASLVPVVLLAIVASYFASRRVTLTAGLDGLYLAGLRKKEFIPHARIRDVRRIQPTPPVIVSPGVVIELADGRVLQLDTRGTRFAAEVWETDPVYDAITDVRARATSDAAATALLQRGERTTAEWMEALRAMAAGKASYRVAPLDERALESVLADANAPVETRAAAAVALRLTAPERLRVAIEEVADADVRGVALASDQEMEEKLGALATSK